MRFMLPRDLSMAAQRFGYPPIRDDQTSGAGEPEKRVNIILGHGHMDNSHTWKRLMPYLMDALEASGRTGPELYARDGLARSPLANDAAGRKLRPTIIALDYLGHGLSDHRHPGSDYSRARWSEDTVRVMDQLGWKKCILMAHSAGGEASSIVAVAFPDRVSHLILLDADGPAPRPARSIPLETASFLRRKLRPPSKKPFYESVEAAVKARSDGNAIDGNLGQIAATYLCERSLVEIERDGRSGFTWRTDSELMGQRVGTPTPETCLQFVKRIRCPTLLLAGDKGRVLERNPPGSPHIKAFTEAVGGNLTYTVVKGGHHAHLQSEEGAKECGEGAGRWIAEMLDVPISRRPTKEAERVASRSAKM